MNTIQNLLESANPWKSLQSDANRLASKWSKTGLLEGMGSEVHKNNMAMILENQAKQLVVESSQTGAGTAGAAFTSGVGEQWAGVALPLVRKVFGQIAAKEFVSVQPMNLPSGLVFFLDFQYGTSKSPFTAAAGNGFYGTESMYGNTNPGATTAANGGLYGAGRFGYSINNTQSVSLTATITSASWADFNFDANYSASATPTTLPNWKKVTITLPANTDFNGVRAFTISSQSAFQPSDVQAAYTTTAGTAFGAAATVSFLVTSSKIANATQVASVANVTCSFQLQPTDQLRGDFEDGNTALNTGNTAATSTAGPGISIPEINVKMKSEPIVAKTRKLKAVWTPEFAQDLNAYHALDAEAELTSIMSEYISLEIDLEIMDMLIQNASAATEYWSAVNNYALDSTGIVNTNLGFYNTQGGWFQTLGTKMQKVSNIIHQKTLRGGANFCVVSPTVATILESIPGFAANTDGDSKKTKYAFGVQKMGQINNRYEVYKNPYMTENVILMGFRGSQFLETGAVFAPYIPLIMTPLVYDPDTFTPRKGLLTRYAKKMVRPEFYGKIYVSGLNTL
jgi:hypothetical protein